MGTWSAGSFGNDDALDFASDVQGQADVITAIEATQLTPSELGLEVAINAVVAAEFIAAKLGRKSRDFPDFAKPVMEKLDTPIITVLLAASKAVESVRNRSELALLWSEEDAQDWHDAIDDLLLRLDYTRPYSEVPEDSIEDEVIEEFGGVCHICEKDISVKNTITLTAEHDVDGIWSSVTLYGHKTCIEERYQPPHFNADGSPHENLIAQFTKATEI